jgi:hypothetical protein
MRKMPYRNLAELLMLLIIFCVVLLPQTGMKDEGSQRSENYSLGGYERVLNAPYVLVGGQNGTWFNDCCQYPKLYRISFADRSVTQLTPINSGKGAVWTGGWNGSQWLISGYGADPGTDTPNPYLFLYDGNRQVLINSTLFNAEASWHGGDVFAISSNGDSWLLSGLGSDVLPGGYGPSNHMSLATFNGSNFTDLSNIVPDQQDAILYANAWNGRYWLIGGGYLDTGVLFTYDGSNIIDLTQSVENAVANFQSVQAIAWNGNYWLIGGIGFLIKYDGQRFADLTPEINAVLIEKDRLIPSCCNAVNTIVWNGTTWMIGGGTPIAITSPQSAAWAVTYDGSSKFTDLSRFLPSYLTAPVQVSSILTATYTNGYWIFGGYSDGKGALLFYANNTFNDLSDLIGEMSYVSWVGANSL